MGKWEDTSKIIEHMNQNLSALIREVEKDQKYAEERFKAFCRFMGYEYEAELRQYEPPPPRSHYKFTFKERRRNDGER